MWSILALAICILMLTKYPIYIHPLVIYARSACGKLICWAFAVVLYLTGYDSLLSTPVVREFSVVLEVLGSEQQTTVCISGSFSKRSVAIAWEIGIHSISFEFEVTHLLNVAVLFIFDWLRLGRLRVSELRARVCLGLIESGSLNPRFAIKVAGFSKGTTQEYVVQGIRIDTIKPLPGFVGLDVELCHLVLDRSHGVECRHVFVTVRGTDIRSVDAQGLDKSSTGSRSGTVGMTVTIENKTRAQSLFASILAPDSDMVIAGPEWVQPMGTSRVSGCRDTPDFSLCLDQLDVRAGSSRRIAAVSCESLRCNTVIDCRKLSVELSMSKYPNEWVLTIDYCRDLPRPLIMSDATPALEVVRTPTSVCVTPKHAQRPRRNFALDLYESCVIDGKCPGPDGQGDVVSLKVDRVTLRAEFSEKQACVDLSDIRGYLMQRPPKADCASSGLRSGELSIASASLRIPGLASDDSSTMDVSVVWSDPGSSARATMYPTSLIVGEDTSVEGSFVLVCDPPTINVRCTLSEVSYLKGLLDAMTASVSDLLTSTWWTRVSGTGSALAGVAVLRTDATIAIRSIMSLFKINPVDLQFGPWVGSSSSDEEREGIRPISRESAFDVLTRIISLQTRESSRSGPTMRDVCWGVVKSVDVVKLEPVRRLRATARSLNDFISSLVSRY